MTSISNTNTATVVSISTRAARTAQRFSKDERGATAMMFGLLLTPVVFLTGMAVDLSRSITMKNRMQTAIDAAALAGMRAQGGYSSSASAATTALTMQNAANAYYDVVTKPWRGGTATPGAASPITVTANATAGSYTFNVDTWIKTPFLSIMNGGPALSGAPASTCSGNRFRCQKLSASATMLASASGANTGYSIETSLMLDITGSMSGQKLTDAKAAANAAIDLLIWQDTSKYSSRIALVPFAQDVRLPTMKAFQKVTNSDLGQSWCTSTGGTFNAATGVCTKPIYGNNFTTKTTEFCVVERTGANKYADASPGSNNSFSMIERIYNNNASSSNAKCNVPANAAIQPLTADKTILHNLVDGLQTAGSTAGHIGTAWAWYTLSPQFNDLWEQDNQAKSYDTAYNINTNTGDVSKVKLKKIAVLMTDGDYNTQFNSMGINTGYFGDAPANDTSQNQAAALCSGMKAKGIEVYTVGFSAPDSNGNVMSNASKTFLKNCATDANHFYDASTGDALIKAFKDIAMKVSAIRYTQ